MRGQSNHGTSSNNHDKSLYSTRTNRGHLHQVKHAPKIAKLKEEVQARKSWRKFPSLKAIQSKEIHNVQSKYQCVHSQSPSKK